jgi:excinuclease ABC subunit B
VIERMNEQQLKRAIDEVKQQMMKAAKDLDFLTAAKLRDEMQSMEKMMKEKKQTAS